MVYAYHTPWHFVFLRNNALLGAFSLVYTGCYLAISALEGFPNFPVSYWNSWRLVKWLDIFP